ncbi:MAG: hypothetical protein EOP86_13995 [Verrucomicrobiaceae bacterium]|nr:MAG: hypothetical protein EOP86_13995 [Verrucomicrobiaceae bacterium]
MVPGALPPAPCFASRSRMVTIDPHDPHYEWYDAGGWEGSLVWYWGRSGDAIIFHPDGTPGVWCHVDCEDGRTWPIGMDFPKLLEELGSFILEEGDAESRPQNLFYH